ncbi:hypothetical protein I5M27_12060 [Adhaeribacter sp. BT258]|uniref:DUF4488 domain-containing protein n=1 Tax=Adhaeribacter terrigena TaxID=2793070 RepID=A0ABS1C312_9BACT|nr:hypothetical protein [Adhaeribacter terrigena]MBK0403725.1 hypothetical protein [Adhaeribacter terrigena]
MKKLLLLASFLSFCFQTKAQHYNKYCNSVIPFCVDVPGNFIRKGESKTGSGQYFNSKDGSLLTIYGSYNSDNENLKQRFDREKAALTTDTSVANSTQLPVIEKAELHENSFTIIYQTNGVTTSIYRKLKNNLWKNIELQYPVAKTPEYTVKMQRMIGSWQ